VTEGAAATRPGPRSAATDTQRQKLVDELLAAPDGAGCAAAALGWLARHAGLERGLCATVDRAAGALSGIAGHGLPAPAATFRVDLAAQNHPLVVAMSGRETVHFRRAASAFGAREPSPLGGGAFWAVPIQSASGERRLEHGLLLLAGGTGRGLQRQGSWAAGLLARFLAGLEAPSLATEERRHARELALLRGVLEAVTDPILLTDAEGRMLVANRGAERLLAAEDEASEGRRRAVAMNNMLFSAAAFTGGPVEAAPTRREVLMVDPVEGQDLLFELLSTPFEIRRGELGAVSILRDVTDLRRATQEIEENYRRLRVAEARTRAERDRLDLILNAAIDPILVTDHEGRLARMNPPAERLFGARDANPSGEIERRVSANDVVLTSFLSKLTAAQADRLKGNLSFADPATGESIPMEALAAKVVTRQGEVSAVVTMLHDLSEAVEKVRLYEQVKRHSEELELRVREATAEVAEQNEVLRRQALELEQASALKSQFLANVSHELRTPLNAIIGYASLLLEGISGALTAPQREKLGRLESNAQSLLAIINDLLDISRIEAGKMALDIVRFDPVELIAEVMAEVEPLIAGSRLEVEREIAEGIPALASDRQKVKQILVNLLSNALKFTPRGRVRVRAGFDPASDRLAVAVADTGVGIPPDNRVSIFEAFGQAGGSFQRRQGGTGLGLSISRRLARMLGGDITVESEVGVGSTFTVELPRVSSAS
jgi:PAS domain S-box-containing protein